MKHSSIMREKKKPILFLFLVLITLWMFSLESRGKEIKNIILFIGDGMGLEQVKAAGIYLNGKPGTLVFESFPYISSVKTYSANSEITDSAAAATAMATGYKVNNRVISMAYPGDESELVTLLEYYSSLGKSTGLVTRTYITHATPAAFGAHEPSRLNYNEIGVDYFKQTRPNLLLGGGGFGVSKELAISNGYFVVNTREELLDLEPGANRLVSAQFGTDNMPYEIDQETGIPTLEEMTKAAISLLEMNKKGFFLMVEGGRIDHAGHNNDIEKNIHETIAFHQSVSYAYQWAQQRTDTLILVTADHETGGLKVLTNNGQGEYPTVSWSSTHHTSQDVGIYGFGVDVKNMSSHPIDNTEIYSLLYVPVYQLKVQSIAVRQVKIMVSPNDFNGEGNGISEFTRSYNQNTVVNLTAPFIVQGKEFQKWTMNNKSFSSQSIGVTMTSNKTIQAHFKEPDLTGMSLDKKSIYFGYVPGGEIPSAQTISIIKEGDHAFKWTATHSDGWVNINPSAGDGSGSIDISILPVNLKIGNYMGEVIITDWSEINSPQMVSIHLQIKKKSQDKPPMGSFDSPIDYAVVSNSLPITGWAIDDIGIEDVTIFRNPIAGEGVELMPIGDGYFVEGVRPDIEVAFPSYPENYKAGWGYVMLSNLLPGDGEYTLYAVATDINDYQTLLGAKKIYVDNSISVKPFGAIDTPKMGEIITGSSYRNQGWALTPPPAVIPRDGSTMRLLIDGIEIGVLNYNVFREDVFSLFPGYANSQGAMAFFDLDPRFFRSGMHTISWLVTDNKGNIDGIDSKYFYIVNNSSINTVSSGDDPGKPIHARHGIQNVNIDSISFIDYKVHPLERIQIEIMRNCYYLTGYMIANNEHRPLPVGSFLNLETGTFSWIPGPASFGEYQLLFTAMGNPDEESSCLKFEQKIINIKVIPGKNINQ